MYFPFPHKSHVPRLIILHRSINRTILVKFFVMWFSSYSCHSLQVQSQLTASCSSSGRLTQQDKLWHTIQTVAHTTNRGTHYKLWHTLQNVTLTTNCGTHYKPWHSLQTVAHTTKCGTHYKMWHTLRTVAHTTKCGTHYKLWHTPQNVAHTTNFLANLGSCVSKKGAR